MAVTAAVRGAGAVLDGVIRIGPDDAEILTIARSADTVQGGMTAVPSRDDSGRPRHELSKCNRRDLAAIIAGGHSAATTVSAPLWIARRFGLEPRVMATGGLGGVHREASTTFDISTDPNARLASEVAAVLIDFP